MSSKAAIRLAHVSRQRRSEYHVGKIPLISQSKLQSSQLSLLEPNQRAGWISSRRRQHHVTHHHASLEQQVVYGLGDISSVYQVVVGVFMFAVSHLQDLHKRHHRRDRDLMAEKNSGKCRQARPSADREKLLQATW